jgi:hypothetical protein
MYVRPGPPWTVHVDRVGEYMLDSTTSALEGLAIFFLLFILQWKNLVL